MKLKNFFVRKLLIVLTKFTASLDQGLLEKIYETCFCYELNKKEILYQRQLKLPIQYDGIKFDEGLQLDVLVDKRVICELKAVENINSLWQAQIISHLKLTLYM